MRTRISRTRSAQGCLTCHQVRHLKAGIRLAAMQDPSPLASRSGFGYGAGMGRVLKPCPASPNCVSSLAQEHETHRVPPLAWTGDLAQAKTMLRSAVLAAGDATFGVEEDAHWHVEVRSSAFP